MNLAAHFPYSSKQHVFYVFNTYLLQDVKNSVRIVLIMKNYINKKRETMCILNTAGTKKNKDKNTLQHSLTTYPKFKPMLFYKNLLKIFL